MSFEHASVTKALMVVLALTSIAAGIFDVKHELHLQLVPHISKHHQYWRLFAHHLACATSGDLLLTELLLYNGAIHIERAFGSVKFASFLTLAVLINTILTFVSLIGAQVIPKVGVAVNYIPPGPTALVFSVVFQYFRLVPQAYEFKVFGIILSDKIWVYATAAQLALGHVPATLLTAAIGFATGYIYRSDLLQLKGWRIPHRLVIFGATCIKPLLGEERGGRRSNRVFPEQRVRASQIANLASRDEPVTTARPSTQRTPRPTPARHAPTPANAGRAGSGSSSSTSDGSDAQDAGPGPGVVRQWVSELAGAARPNAGAAGGTVRVPTEAEIETLTAMFPDVGREVVLGVLQRSPNIEAAAETLLTAAHA